MRFKRFSSVVPTKKKIKQRLEIPIFLFCYFLFLVAGGFIIKLIEEEPDKMRKNDRRIELLDVLKKYGKLPNDTMILEIIRAAAKTSVVKGLNLKDLTEEVESTWGLSGGVFFCATLITTIGYGDRFPITTGGRWFTIVYAIFGIPFTGILLAKIGTILANLIKNLDNKLTKLVKKFQPKRTTAEGKLMLYVRSIQIMVVLGIFILMFWILPAVIMVQIEPDWSYITSIYYCFVTITTIGLGDVVPGTSTAEVQVDGNFSAANLKTAIIQASTLLYFLLGLSALTILIKLVQSALNAVALSAKAKAENFSSKGMKFIGNMHSTVRQIAFNKQSGNEACEEDTKGTDEKLPDIAEDQVDEPKGFGLDNLWDHMEETNKEKSILNIEYENDSKETASDGAKSQSEGNASNRAEGKSQEKVCDHKTEKGTETSEEINSENSFQRCGPKPNELNGSKTAMPEVV